MIFGIWCSDTGECNDYRFWDVAPYSWILQNFGTSLPNNTIVEHSNHHNQHSTNLKSHSWNVCHQRRENNIFILQIANEHSGTAYHHGIMFTIRWGTKTDFAGVEWTLWQIPFAALKIGNVAILKILKISKVWWVRSDYRGVIFLPDWKYESGDIMWSKNNSNRFRMSEIMTRSR
jgi:hypothetical protein